MRQHLALLFPILAVGCFADEAPDFDTNTQALAAGFGTITAYEAGYTDGFGSMAQVAWSGPPCDASCTVEVDFGAGWQVLKHGVEFNFLTPWVLETGGLSRGSLYKFRVTTPPIPGTTQNHGNGFATSTPSYPGETSPDAMLVTQQQPAAVQVTITNQGNPNIGTALPSPFFNGRDPNTGLFVPEVVTKSELSYAYLDSNHDGVAVQNRFAFETIQQPDGAVVDYRKANIFGPAQSHVFDLTTDPNLPSVFDWQPLHSNLLADDGRDIANLIVVARVQTWRTANRPQFFAAHIAVDKSTGAVIAPVALVGGDIERNDRSDQRVILASALGEPPTITRWDWMPNPGGLPRVVGGIAGVIEFVNPNTGIAFMAHVDFEFEIDVNWVP